MFKKYTSAILALVMVMALALPGVYAFSSSNYMVSSGQYANGTGDIGSNALQDNKTEQEVKPGVVMAVPPLKIVFQGSGAVILNPYKLNIKLNNAANSNVVTSQDGTTVYSNSSVVGIPVVVESKTGAPVLVSVKAKATKSGSAKFEFSTSDIANTEKNKKVQLWLEGKDSDSNWNTKYTSGKVGMVIFSDNPSNFTKLHVIDAYTGNGTTDPAIKGYFKVSGFMTEAPTDPWTASDVVTASITFKFEPVSMNYKITL